MISTIRDLEIDYDGNTSGYGDISFIGGEFISRTNKDEFIQGIKQRIIG